MNINLKYILTLLLLIPLFLFGQTKVINISDFGAQGDGQRDDFSAIQKALNTSKNIPGSTVRLEQNKVYKISKPLNVFGNIDGNGSVIVPMSTLGLKINKDNIRLSNLKVKSNIFKYLRIDKNNITIENCDFETRSYYALLVIEADGVTIDNSILNNLYAKTNRFNKGRFYAISSRTGISDLSVTNNQINGGIYISTNSPKKMGNYIFKNNKITVDFTNAPQNFNTQHDAFVLVGASDVFIQNNNFEFINVNRGFHITDLYSKVNGKIQVSEFPPSNINFLYNTINSKAINGKQLFGLFVGTQSINLKNNKIYSRGHVTIFENKTTTDKLNRTFLLEDNDIYFDNEIMYMNGNAERTDVKNDVIVKNNRFYYDDSSFNFISKRSGQDLDIKFNYVMNIRNVGRFQYENNKLVENNAKLQFQNRHFFYLKNVLESEITKSNYKGVVKFEPQRQNSKITLSQNNITESGFDKKIVTDPKNTVKYQAVIDN